MTDLLPCPFCGGEAKPYDYWEKWIIECEDCEKYGHGAYVVARTEAEAIAAWNNRAERTCKNVDEYARAGFFVCGNCGFGNGDIELVTNYCPNCGAKVVS